MNKDYSLLKVKAIKLRRKGLSYNEIRKQINISKSTLSYWLKSVPLKSEHKKRLYTKSVFGLARGGQSQKERRLKEVNKIIEAAEKEIERPLSFEAYRLFGAALYWAEGSKGKMFQITNSDPHLILFIVHWIEKICGIPPNGLTLALNIHSQQNEKDIKKFWSDLTGVPIRNFTKTYIKKFTTGFKKNNLYYGTVRIYLPKSADFKVRLFGWIKSVLKDIDHKIQVVENRWNKLRKNSRPVNLY